MKKVSISTLTILLALLFMGSAKALTVDVTCTPEAISVGGMTTITVSSDQTGSGSITVTTPGGTSSICSITVPAGGSVSKVYPTDFPSGSTSEHGEYDVIVSLSGKKWSISFWVTFMVVPENPIGTLMATVASLGAMAGLKTTKRLRLKL